MRTVGRPSLFPYFLAPGAGTGATDRRSLEPPPPRLAPAARPGVSGLSGRPGHLLRRRHHRPLPRGSRRGRGDPGRGGAGRPPGRPGHRDHPQRHRGGHRHPGGARAQADLLWLPGLPVQPGAARPGDAAHPLAGGPAGERREALGVRRATQPGNGALPGPARRHAGSGRPRDDEGGVGAAGDVLDHQRGPAHRLGPGAHAGGVRRRGRPGATADGARAGRGGRSHPGRPGHLDGAAPPDGQRGRRGAVHRRLARHRLHHGGGRRPHRGGGGAGAGHHGGAVHLRARDAVPHGQ